MAEETTPAEEAAPASGGRTVEELRELADALRGRVDLFGKTLAAVATLGTGAVGLSKIGDLFPDEGHWWAVVIACLGLFAAALAAVFVAVRLMKVARPAYLDAGLTDLEDDETKVAEPIYKAAAGRFGYESLAGLQGRERSLRSAANRAADPEERARRTALADQVQTEIEQAFARAQVAVVRKRSTNAVEGWSYLWYAVAIAGLIAFALSTDYVASERSDAVAEATASVAEAKACGEAREAGATDGELGRTDGACDGEAKKEEQPAPPSAAQARAKIAGELSKVLTACSDLIAKAGDPKSGPLDDADCNAVRQAVAGIDPVSK